MKASHILPASTWTTGLTLACLALSVHAETPSTEHVTAPIQLLRATQHAFRRVSDTMRPYLVRVETVGGSQPRGFVRAEDEETESGKTRRLQNQFREQVGSNFVIADGPTTGIIYSSDGYIICSSFNFVRDPVLISVALADGRQLAAQLVARDQVRKIALLKIDARDLPTPTWLDLSQVAIGQWAVALGLGFGGDEPSVTAGIVSALGRMHGNAVQTDAKLSPANYGGPLCDLTGRIIGICVPMAQRPGELAGIDMYDSGVGFAVPKHRVDSIVDTLKRGRSFYRGWLGIQIEPRSTDAVVIRNIAVPSPMHEVGAEIGDRIVAAADRPIHHFGNLMQALYMIPAGEKVGLRLERDGREIEVTIKLARNTELGPLPDLEEPFDPSEPIPVPEPDDK
ncbi:MAG: S1C family serine protease [Phycisphaerae bacterium]